MRARQSQRHGEKRNPFFLFFAFFSLCPAPLPHQPELAGQLVQAGHGHEGVDGQQVVVDLPKKKEEVEREKSGESETRARARPWPWV